MRFTTPWDSNKLPQYNITEPQIARLKESACCGCLSVRGWIIFMSLYALFMSGLELCGATGRVRSYHAHKFIGHLAVAVYFSLSIAGFYALRTNNPLTAKRFTLYWWFVSLASLIALIASIASGTAIGYANSMCYDLYNEYIETAHFDVVKRCEEKYNGFFICISLLQVTFMFYGGVIGNRFTALQRMEHALRQTHGPKE